MRFLSLCSGIEAASVAWTPLGWEAVAFSEIDPFPSAVLAHRFPDVPNLGDMTKYEKWPEFESIDLICAGTPCQSFSQAGLRKGLDDPRGNLMLTFGHILAKYRPKWFVWENVPGVLSSNIGRDFAAFLGLVTGQSVEPPKDGWRKAGCLSGIDSAYGVSWRVLDAQFTRTPAFPRAVPQRRQRVFVVGYLGDWRRAATVLVDGESLSGNPAPGRSAGQGFAGDARTGIEMGGGQRVYDNHAADARYNELNGVCTTVTAKYGTGGGNVPLVAKSGGYTVGGFGEYKEGVGTLRAQGGDLGGGSETLVAEVSHTLTGDGFDASEDETGRGTPIIPEIAQTIMASEYKGIGHNREDNLIAFTCKDHGADAGDVAPTLRSMNHSDSHANGGGQVAIAWSEELTASEEVAPRLQHGGQGGRHDGVMTMAFSAGNSANARGIGLDEELSPPLRAAESGTNQVPTIMHPVAVHQNADGELRTSDVGYTVSTNGNASGRNVGIVAEPQMRVRRLMPVECERLQGFPNDWSKIPWRGKPAEECPDGRRYKAIGNSWATNCAEWIGIRIQMVEDMFK